MLFESYILNTHITMGSNSSSTAVTDVKINQSNKSSSDITNNTPLSSSSCPVSNKHNKITPSIVSASQSTTDSVTVSIANKSSESACPVKYKNPEVFNVRILNAYLSFLL